jgi:glycosyltransferase involved in cell wall biosynthesis
MAGVPRLIHTDHGRQKDPDALLDRLVDGLASRRTDVIVAVSEALARQLAATVVRDPGRIRVIPNGVDTELFRPGIAAATLRAELGLERGQPILGSIGRFDRIKGYDIMLEAYAVLVAGWRAGPVPALVLAGEGPEESRLIHQARALPPPADVRFLGWRSDLGNLFDSFSLFTLASRSEGTSLSLLEAMSSECCPVVTNVGGNAVVLGPELAHRLVAPSDPHSLASAWCQGLADPVRRTEDAVRARRRVEACYSLQAMVRAYESLYLEDLTGRRPVA